MIVCFVDVGGIVEVIVCYVDIGGIVEVRGDCLFC
jgi:hypothetical protein